jgi:hypothetical protein
MLMEKSAEEELADLVASHDWDAAMRLAELHSLSKEPVYRCPVPVKICGSAAMQELTAK